MTTTTLHYTVYQPLNNVYKSLYDFKVFGRLHPYMKSVKIMNQSENSVECLVHEQLKLWGFIPMAPCYRVIVTEVEKDKRIRYSSEVKKGLFLTIEFILEQKLTHTTEVIEQISLEGQSWVHQIFLSLLKKSHRHVFKMMHQTSTSISL